MVDVQVYLDNAVALFRRDPLQAGVVLVVLVVCVYVMGVRPCLRRRAAAPAINPVPVRAVPEWADYTLAELRKFNGVDDPTTLIGNMGLVFDVTGSKFYAAPSPYAIFAGRDATKLFARFSTDAADLDDVTPLTDAERGQARGWADDLRMKYDVVGRLADSPFVGELSDAHLAELRRVADQRIAAKAGKSKTA